MILCDIKSFFYSDLESALAPRAFHGMLALLSGQAQDRFALGAGTENMGCRIGGAVAVSAPEQTGLQPQKRHVFSLTLGDVFGETAIHGPDEQGNGDDV